MMNQTQAEVLRERIADLEEIFVDIRNHPETTRKVRGLADFGQGRAVELKMLASQLIQNWRSSASDQE